MSLAALGFHHAGRPIGDPRKAWATACGEAKIRSLLFPDLRRSAVREMDRAGVRQTVAMKITGHKTPSIGSAGRAHAHADRDQARNVVSLRSVSEDGKAWTSSTT